MEIAEFDFIIFHYIPKCNERQKTTFDFEAFLRGGRVSRETTVIK